MFTRGTWYDSMTLDPKVKNSLAERDDKAHNVLRSKLIRGVCRVSSIFPVLLSHNCVPR